MECRVYRHAFERHRAHSLKPLRQWWRQVSLFPCCAPNSQTLTRRLQGNLMQIRGALPYPCTALLFFDDALKLFDIIEKINTGLFFLGKMIYCNKSKSKNKNAK